MGKEMSLSEDWLAFGPVEGCFDMSRLRSALDELDRTPVDGLIKGYPVTAPTSTLGAVATRGWNVLGDDLPFPLAVLKRSALEHNACWMRTYQQRQGASLAPHAKTSMAPHLWTLQGAVSCWGMTVATIQQAAVAARFGCRNIIIANQVIGHANLMGLMNLHRSTAMTRFMVFVDSEAVIRALLAALRGCGCERPLDVMIELGMAGGRTGCRDVAEVDKLLDVLSGERERLRLVGVSAFEGVAKDAADARLTAILDLLGDAARLADRRNIFAEGEVILSAGGSKYFDVVTERLRQIRLHRTTRIVLRSGCYLTHDSCQYETQQQAMRARHPEQFEGMDPLVPALFVWSMVQSRPEPGLAILTMGKRDVGFDEDMPQPALRYRRHKTVKPVAMANAAIFALNDQHAYMRIAPDDDVAVGDLVACGVSHPCTTFDRWRVVHVVDDDWTSQGAIMTFF
jgi:D-serine dehydratase